MLSQANRGPSRRRKREMVLIGQLSCMRSGRAGLFLLSSLFPRSPRKSHAPIVATLYKIQSMGMQHYLPRFELDQIYKRVSDAKLIIPASHFLTCHYIIMTRQRRHMEHWCYEWKATSYKEDRVVVWFPQAVENCEEFNCRIPRPEDKLRYFQVLRCAKANSPFTRLRCPSIYLLVLVSRGR